MRISDSELERVARIAVDAGREILAVYATDFSVERKGDASPVTIADHRANAVIVEALRAAFPADGIISEEGVIDHADRRRNRCWFVDPLDGTKDFIAKNGEFSVMIGLAIDGVATAGVVHQPSRSRTAVARVDSFATLFDGSDERPLRVSDAASPSELVLVSSRSHGSSHTDDAATRLGITRKKIHGSVGLKALLVAAREADVYFHFSAHASLWDTCAGDALIKAAGGMFTDTFGDPIRYDQGDLQASRGILAIGRAAFPHAIESISAVAREAGFTPG